MVTAVKTHGRVYDAETDGRCRSPLTKKQLEQIDQYATDQAKTATIAEALGVDYDWLKRNYEKRLRQKRAEGKLEILENQRECGKNPIMAMFRGKVNLGQDDKAGGKQDVHVTISHGSFSPVPEAAEAHEKPLKPHKESSDEV